MIDIPVYYALLAGAISFLSPCVLPLVPPYLCYMAGASLSEISGSDVQPVDADLRRKVVGRALLFVLGFSVVFISLGASATFIGQFLLKWSNVLSQIAGVIIILMGLHFLGLFRFALLQREARFQAGGGGAMGTFVMGLAFAFGWTPCIGPILAPILGLAGSRETMGEGAFLLGVYSAGLGIPFVLAALFVGPFMNFLERFRKHLHRVEQIAGVLLVLTGILFLTGGMQRFAFWLLETFPVLGTIG
ncbi:MAG: cytochrome c biogenesis protein CcdA [Rhizobiaceae bacterium]|nr:cytochrome c biogenesis protein CcdA [Rhizobiaceae bacterium]